MHITKLMILNEIKHKDLFGWLRLRKLEMEEEEDMRKKEEAAKQEESAKQEEEALAALKKAEKQAEK